MHTTYLCKNQKNGEEGLDQNWVKNLQNGVVTLKL